MYNVNQLLSLNHKNIIFILSEDLDDCTKNGPMVIFICGHQPKLCRTVGKCEMGRGAVLMWWE